MEHADRSHPVSPFAGDDAPLEVGRATSTIEKLARILGLRFLGRPRGMVMSSRWLRQHEVDFGKHGQV